MRSLLTRIPKTSRNQPLTRAVSSCSTSYSNSSGRSQSQDYDPKLAFASVIGLGILTSATLNKKYVKCDQVDCGATGEWKNGDMRSFQGPDDRKAVVVKYKGKYYATTNKCARGCLLEKGVAGSDGTIISPLYNSAYDLATGRSLRGPSMTGIGTYPVSVENDRVLVDISDKVPMFPDPDMVKRDPNNKRVIAIVGAGAAGIACAETLRAEGYTGRVVMISKERHAPYERVICSKVLTKESKELELRSTEWLEDHGIEFWSGSGVKNVDATNRKIEFDDKRQPLQFDEVLLATGSIAREVWAPGYDLGNIFTLRSIDDAHNIAKMTMAYEDPKVIIIGSSFIGMEVASTLSQLGAKVTMVGLETMPYERVLGRKVGAAFALLLDKAGVEFIGNRKVTIFRGDFKVRAVEMEEGDKHRCDIVVTGAGVIPNTTMFKDVAKSRDGGIVVDPFLQSSSHKHVYAAGDIATFPYWRTGQHIRCEHWDTAMQQGRIVAKNMLGQMKPYKAVPFFWSQVFEEQMRYVGWTDRYDEVHVEGNALQQNFVAYYIYKGDVVSVATMGNEDVTAAVSDLMMADKMPDAYEILSGKINGKGLVALQKELASAPCCSGKKKTAKVSSSWISWLLPGLLSAPSSA